MQALIWPGSVKVLLLDIAGPLMSPSCYSGGHARPLLHEKSRMERPGINPSSEFSFCRLPCDLDLANLSEPHFSITGGRVCIFYTENSRTSDFVTCPS